MKPKTILMLSKMGKTQRRSGTTFQRTRTTALAFAPVLLAALLLFLLLEFENEKIRERQRLSDIILLLRFCLHSPKISAPNIIGNTAKR